MALEAKDISSQIGILKSKNLTINDPSFTRSMLEKNNYYNLINAFKDLFLASKNPEIYITGTTFEEIYNVYIFDLSLRELFLKYILCIENEFKTHVAYVLSLDVNSGCYFSKSCYDTGSKKKKESILKTQNMIFQIYEKNSNNPMVSHFLDKGEIIPLWALLNIFEFGQMRSFYNILKPNLKNKVSKYYSISSSDLYSMLSALNMFRNVCAHGNRLYNYKLIDDQKQIVDTIVHSNMKINKISAGGLNYYSCGKKDLFSVVICFKYLLDNTDFNLFFDELNELISSLSSKIKTINIEKILTNMGFSLANASTGQKNWDEIKRIAK